MTEELKSFIDTVYREPYSLLKNNCIHKSLRIKAKAEELGSRADIVTCISVVPIKKWHDFPSVNFHMYALVDGQKVDVSLDPRHEEMYCKNSEKRLLLPVNVSRLKRTVLRAVSPIARRERNAYR